MVREGAAAWKSLPEEAKAFDTLELPEPRGALLALYHSILNSSGLEFVLD